MSFAQVPNYVPTNGLVGWWPFNGNANDESGNGNNGIVNGATLTTDRNGNINSAYSFDGNSNISLNNVSLSNVIKYSYTGWFKKASTTINQGANIISMSNPCNGPGGLRVGIGGNNQFCFGAEFQSCSSVWQYSQNQNYSDNTWHFFAAVYDGNIGQIQSSELILYIDGVLIPQTPFTQGNTGNVIAPINNLGIIALIGGLDGIIRDIDDIGIWNRALTDCEIQNLYNSSNPTNTTTATACDSYTWNGTTYSESGVYTGTTANCVTESLNLTITQTFSDTTIVIACDSYTWNGTTYTESGTYTGITENCITQSLKLTINPSTSNSISQTALDSYTWPVNSQTYTTTGAYTAVIPNASGCDSTITLNLTMSFTGINDLSASKLSIYPNPTNGDFTITGLDLLGTVSTLTLTDMNGKVVKVLDTKATKFSMGAIKPGVYFLNIISGNKQEVLKIVKD